MNSVVCSRWAVLSIIGITLHLYPVGFLQAEGELSESVVLGSPPLCEASGAAWFPGQPDLIAVVDNEIHDRIFLFQTVEEQLVFRGELPLPARHRPRDLEAITVDGEQLILVGSHSLNRMGEYKDKRHRIRWLVLDDSWGLHEQRYRDRGQIDRRASTHLESCLLEYFSAGHQPRQVAFCEALVGGEEPGGLNIEGAVMVEHNGEHELWLGLRGPTIEEGAVILRLPGRESHNSEMAVSVIHLGGEGIREMAQGSGGIWLISGPVEDSEQAFSLWHFPNDQMGEEIHPQLINSNLPSGSEGLVVGDNRAWVMIDGEEGENETSCSSPSRYVSIGLSPQ